MALGKQTPPVTEIAADPAAIGQPLVGGQRVRDHESPRPDRFEEAVRALYRLSRIVRIGRDDDSGALAQLLEQGRRGPRSETAIPRRSTPRLGELGCERLRAGAGGGHAPERGRHRAGRPLELRYAE